MPNHLISKGKTMRLQDMGTTGLIDYIKAGGRKTFRLRRGQVTRAMRTRGDSEETIDRLITAAIILYNRAYRAHALNR